MIEDPLEELGKRLLSYESSDAQFGEKYRREISTLLRRELNPIGRWVQFLAGTVFVLVGLFGIVVAPHMTNPPQPVVRWAGLVGCSYMAVWGVAMLICAIWCLNPNRYQVLWFSLGTLSMVAMAAVLLNGSWQAEDTMLREQLTHGAFALLGILGVSTIVYFLEYYHKQTQLKLLELEYRLAGLAAKMERE
ncbi:MAG: hypothetical protein ACM359_18500 [Bacillota bacterium]